MLEVQLWGSFFVSRVLKLLFLNLCLCLREQIRYFKKQLKRGSDFVNRHHIGNEKAKSRNK